MRITEPEILKYLGEYRARVASWRDLKSTPEQNRVSLDTLDLIDALVAKIQSFGAD